MNKILVPLVTAFLVVSFLAIPVFAAGTLTPHASVQGWAMVKTGCRWERDKDAVMTFIQYTPGEGSRSIDRSIAFMNVSAVSALPLDWLILLEDSAFGHVLK